MYVIQSTIPNQLAANKVFLQGTDKEGRGLMIVLAARHDAWYASADEVLRMMCYGLDAVVRPKDTSSLIFFITIGINFNELKYIIEFNLLQPVPRSFHIQQRLPY